LSDASAFFHASLFFAFSALVKGGFGSLPATTTAAVKGIFRSSNVGLLSIQSSVAVVIASDDDGGGQRYIQTVAMSALSIQ
jgi:hypothetical protein